MKKLGFTLAEVLIALAIVGVVAAITLPTFVSNGKNQANASKLAVEVNAIENALTTMIAREGIDDLTESEWVTGGFAIGDLGKYLKLNGSRGDTYQTYYTSDSPYKTLTNTALKPGIDKIYETKNGALLGVVTDIQYSRDEATVKALGGSAYQSIGFMAIDVNGAAKPNIWGRDVFYFIIGADGHLYPSGSLNFSVLVYTNNANIWTKSGGTYSCTGNSLSHGCTARLIENNYKMDY